MTNKNGAGIMHCEECGKVYIFKKCLLNKETNDEYEECEKLGFCSPKCLYINDSKTSITI